ncbi:acyltransferase [Clostridium perfringens]|nr:acyltransferase [Clostridium perfringens]
MKNKNEFLQVLRAILFLMIFSYHCEIPGTNFFWAGIEVFFCISGFFIFKKIFKNTKKEREIYIMVKSRIKRLYFPDYLIIVMVCVLIIYIDGKFDFFRFISFVLCFQNIAWLLAGLKEYSILAHMWTISIEVQTILIIGLLIIILYKFGFSKTLIIPLMFLISLVYVLIFPYFLNSNLVFSLCPLSHFFAFALGGLILLFTKRNVNLSKLGLSFVIIGVIGIWGISLFISKIYGISITEAFLSMNSASVNILIGRPVSLIYVFISLIGGGILSICINHSYNISYKFIDYLVNIGDDSFLLYLLHYPIIRLLSDVLTNRMIIFVLSLIFTFSFAKLLNALKKYNKVLIS